MHILKGSAWMILFCILLPLGDSLTRLLREGGLHVTQVLFLEYSIITLVVFPFIKKPKMKQILLDPLKGWHFLRAISFFLAAIFWLGVIKYIPLTQLYAMGFLAPIFASFMSPFLLNETLTKHKVGSLIASLIGALVIIRPGFVEVSPFLILGLLSPLFWAFTTISTKRLASHYSHLTLLFIMSATTVVLSAPLAIYYWIKIPPNLWILVPIIVSIGLIVHFALIFAYKYAPLTVLAPLEFSTLLSATLYASLFFDESMDLLTCVGALMIVASNIYVTVKTNQKVRPISSHLDM